jgi:hypothetical protein
LLHISLLFFGVLVCGFLVAILARFWDNFSPDCCTFWVNFGQDWLRAFATCLFRLPGLLSFREFLQMAIVAREEESLCPEETDYLGCPQKNKNEG